MRARSGCIAILGASMIALLCATSPALADPVLTPLPDTVYHFDRPEKFILFFPPNGARHAGNTMTWRYNDANRPAAIAKATVLSQIRASMARWSAACPISFVEGAETSAGFTTSDGINVIGWTLTGLNAPTTGDASIASNGTNITDADIRLNAAYSVTYSPSLEPTVTHEVGHAIGINHSDVNGQVMSGPPSSTYNGTASLGSDDIAACQALYGGGGPGPGPDTQAPTVPGGLAAVATSTTVIGLTWNASTDNVGVANYRVFNNGNLLGTVTSAGATVSSLSPGTTYTFRVSACDAAGNCSAQSAPAMATTMGGDTQPPTVPTALSATAVSSTQVNLDWAASTDNVGVANYRVFRGGTLLGAVTSTSTTVGSLSPATAYSFTVAACDAAGNCSAQSTPAPATTLAAPSPTTCTAPQPAPDQQTLACPAGQTGSITQSRTYTCVGTTWTPGLYQTVANTCRTAGPETNYQDLWWVLGEDGWGVTITQHRDVLFLAFFVYDATGKPVWVVVSSGTWNAARTTYTGAAYIPTGSWFRDYRGEQFNVGTPVGSVSVTFAGNSAATLAYSVNGMVGTKQITRQPFGPVNNAPIASYGDMWWGGVAEDGWGLVLSQQFHNLFATWFTYDNAGQTTWFVMSAGSWITPTTYRGELYRTLGSQVLGAAYNPAAFSITQVGTLTLTFTDTDHATMTYTVDGFTQSKPITRLPF